jgi:hypothetical protein
MVRAISYNFSNSFHVLENIVVNFCTGLLSSVSRALTVLEMEGQRGCLLQIPEENPWLLDYGDIGGRIFNPTPKPSIRKRLLINVWPRCIMVFRLFGKSSRCDVNQPCNMSGHTVPVIVNSVMESGV